MNSRNIFTGLLVTVFISSCTNTPPTATSTSNQSKTVEDTIDNRRLIHITVLDYYKDTICFETPFEMDSLFESNKYRIGGHYTIDYKTYHLLSKHFINQDPAQKRIQQAIEQMQEYASLKMEFEKTKYHQFNINYVKNIEWSSIHATQIGPEFFIWDNASKEEIAECKKATRKNYSYAEMLANVQLKQPNATSIELYMNKAKEIIFIKDISMMGIHYVLPLDDSEFDAFHFHDLGIIADLNNDGIGDRAATWYKNDSYGVCGITKKTPNGLIRFFQFEIPK